MMLPCALSRYTLDSTRVGPAPERARATAADTASYTATGSPPSTVTPGIENARALTDSGSPAAALASSCSTRVTTL